MNIHRIESDPQLSKLAAQYFARATALFPDLSIAQLEETFAYHIDEAALSPRNLHGYWEHMASQQPLSYQAILYNPDSRLLEVRGRKVRLTAQPLKMMTYLMYKQEEVVEYDELFRLFNSKNRERGQYQIRANLQRVRAGIFDDEHIDGVWDWIQTIPGEGLCLVSRDRVYELFDKGELPFSAKSLMST